MPLDQSYFDAISIDTVKKKYYNANKVEAVLEDIRRQALALSEENAQLKAQLLSINDQKSEIGDTLLSAKAIAQQIVREAKDEARRIVDEAEERRRVIDEGSDRLISQITEEAEQRRQIILAENARLEAALPQRLDATEQQLRRHIQSGVDEACAQLRLLLDAQTPADDADEHEDACAAPDEDAPADEGGEASLPEMDLALEAIAQDIFSLDEDEKEKAE